MKPDPDDALAAALAEVAEVAEGDCSEDLTERLLEIAKKYGEATHPSARPISRLHRWH